MTFLQPWLLPALLLMVVPIVIHFVNQWRYQTKPWAAMMFLIQAQSMHRGVAKLRQWLILAMRALAIAGLIVAISRPLASGFLGSVAARRVDTTIILLDRSPSMSARSSVSNESKLRASLRRLNELLQYRQSERWLVVDSAQPDRVLEFGTRDELLRTFEGETCDSPTNWTQMFRSAIGRLQNDRPTSAEIWVCSDMRAADWKIGDTAWFELKNELDRLSTQSRCLLLAYPELNSENYSASVANTRVVTTDMGRELLLDIQVTSNDSDGNGITIPVEIAIDSSPFQVPVSISHGAGELKDYRIALDESSSTTGWGRLEIPSDALPNDNFGYFVYSLPFDLRTTIFYEEVDAVAPFAVAAEASAAPTNRQAIQLIPLEEADQSDWNNDAMIVWQGELPSGRIQKQLEEFVDGGGSIWFLPPRSLVEQRPPMEDDNSFLGFRWLHWHESAAELHPTSWTADTGLFASSQSGLSLPIGELGTKGFAEFEGQATPLVTLSVGNPLFARLATESGNVFLCSTWPIEPYSNLANHGVALFIAVLRACDMGAAKNQATRSIKAGMSELELERERLPPFRTWLKVAAEPEFRTAEIGLRSGVFDAGGKLVAVNRSEVEDDATLLDDKGYQAWSKSFNVFRIDDTVGSTNKFQQEIWRGFLVLMITALLVEAMLSLPRGSIQRVV
jgi:hypothetical protein